MTEEAKLRRGIAKAEMKMEEALEQQAEAEYQYQSWSKEKDNMLRQLTSLCVDETRKEKTTC